MGKKDSSINEKLADHFSDFTHNRLDITESRGKVTKSIDLHFSSVKTPKSIPAHTSGQVASLVTDINAEYNTFSGHQIPANHEEIKIIFKNLRSPKDRGKVINRLRKILSRAADKTSSPVGNIPIKVIKEAQDKFLDGIK